MREEATRKASAAMNEFLTEDTAFGIKHSSEEVRVSRQQVRLAREPKV